MTFPCTSCGACCRRVGQIKGHNLPINEDGSCKHLVSNQCQIYEERPAICRVDFMMDKVSVEQNIPRIDLFNYTAALCNRFQHEDQMDAQTFNIHLQKEPHHKWQGSYPYEQEFIDTLAENLNDKLSSYINTPD